MWNQKALGHKDVRQVMDDLAWKQLLGIVFHYFRSKCASIKKVLPGKHRTNVTEEATVTWKIIRAVLASLIQAYLLHFDIE